MTECQAAAVVVGASAGAVDALSQVLPLLPSAYALPVMIVVHLPSDKKSVLAELFRSKCQIKTKEAEDKESLLPGCVYFAPPDYHLLVEPDRRLSLSSDEPVNHSRPSIDALFESAADAYGHELIGVVLTGANKDGAVGLAMIIEAGGVGVVQRPDQAYAETMPQAALSACPQALCMSLNQIADYLLKAAQPK